MSRVQKLLGRWGCVLAKLDVAMVVCLVCLVTLKAPQDAKSEESGHEFLQPQYSRRSTKAYAPIKGRILLFMFGMGDNSFKDAHVGQELLCTF